MLVYRKSEACDIFAIHDLIAERFGERPQALQDIEGRYLLCFDGDRLVAMSGCNLSCNYNGFEIDWTCTTKEYEGQGIMTELFRRVLDGVNEAVYCSCWHMENLPECNLVRLMSRFGFVPAIKERLKHDTYHNNCASICVMCKGKERCRCCEDLYVKGEYLK